MRKKQRKVAALAASSSSSPHSSSSNVLLWLRQDLRLHDNAALVAAAAQALARGGLMTLVYVHSPDEDGDDVAAGAVKCANAHDLYESPTSLVAALYAVGCGEDI